MKVIRIDLPIQMKVGFMGKHNPHSLVVKMINQNLVSAALYLVTDTGDN